MIAFKDMLKYLRSRESLSQAELAEKLGIAKSTVSMYEVGKREPDFETLEMISDFFNVDMNFLLGGDISQNSITKNISTNIPDKKYAASLADKNFGDGAGNMLLKYDTLNDIGKKKVQDNIDDLSKIYKTPAFAAPILNAAHERTDIEITPDMRKHDDDIMNDPNF